MIYDVKYLEKSRAFFFFFFTGKTKTGILNIFQKVDQMKNDFEDDGLVKKTFQCSVTAFFMRSRS